MTALPGGMTELERMELVLRRVHDRLEKTSRFGVSDELYLLKKILEELTIENNTQYEQREKSEGE